MKLEEIEEALRTLGRPEVYLARFMATRAEAEAWDVAHPEGAAEFRRLSALLWEAEREWRRKEEAAETQRWVEKKLAASGMGERALAAVASPRPSEALEAVAQWAQTGKAWLALLGGTGTGKTTAAAWAIGEALKKRESAACRTASRLSRMSGFDEGARELDRLSEVSLLVVDDIGAEAQTAWGSGLLSELLDARHQAFRKTILTSNLGLDPFRARVGERMADRIREDGKVVVLGGRSMRGQR